MNKSDKPAIKICYVSTIFKDLNILERFTEHFNSRISNDSRIIVYCHDQATISKSSELSYPNIDYIKGSEAIFFTAAINQAIKFALNKYVVEQFCIIDSDCFVTENFHRINKGFIGKTGIFANREIESDQFLPTGFKIKNWWLGTSMDVSKLVQNSEQKIDYSNGRGLFFPAYAIDEIGYLDERFPLYGSDNEYSLRLGRKYGLIFTSAAIVYSHSHETGDNVLVKPMSLTARFRSLWSIRSSSNLKTRVLFCWIAAPGKIAFIFWSLRSIATAIAINILGNKIKNFTKFSK